MQKIVDFLQIAEKLEREYRLTRKSDGEKQSVAAHSWNMAMMAIVLQQRLKTPVDIERVLKMCVIHDLPEAIVHDVPLHKQTESVRLKKHADEIVAVKRIQNLLNDDKLTDIFNEYEMRKTPEARLVKALDVLDTGVQHMCAKDLAYVAEFDDGFYWKMFFSDEFVRCFDFEPVLHDIMLEIRARVAKRLKDELKIDVEVYKK